MYQVMDERVYALWSNDVAGVAEGNLFFGRILRFSHGLVCASQTPEELPPACRAISCT